MAQLTRLRLAAVLLLASLTPALAAPRTAVISAFAPEATALAAAMTEASDEAVNGVKFRKGKLEDKDIVLFLSGISMVNAAMTTQLALDRFGVDRIVVSGIAGGVDPALSIGDVVVAERWGQYLEAVFARATPEGGWKLPFGEQPGLPNYGMIFPREVRVLKNGLDKPERRFWFEADPGLLDVARRIAATVDLPECAKPGTCLAHKPRVVVGGNGVSGQAFVDNAEFRAWTFATFQARVLDMETAAIAHVAYANGKPMVAFRSLSDLAGGGPGENEMGTFFQIAADNSARVVRAFLAALPD